MCCPALFVLEKHSPSVHLHPEVGCGIPTPRQQAKQAQQPASQSPFSLTTRKPSVQYSCCKPARPPPCHPPFPEAGRIQKKEVVQMAVPTLSCKCLFRGNTFSRVISATSTTLTCPRVSSAYRTNNFVFSRGFASTMARECKSTYLAVPFVLPVSVGPILVHRVGPVMVVVPVLLVC